MDAEQRKGLLRGLIADRPYQFQWAATTAIGVMLPAAICMMVALARLATETAMLRDGGADAGVMSRFVVGYCWSASLVLTLIFASLAGLAFVLSLKTSSHLIGPVRRLESQLENLLKGKQVDTTILRQGDYLRQLAALINTLSQKGSPPEDRDKTLPKDSPP